MAQRPPEKLNFSSPNWDAWRSSFQTFRVVTQLDQEKDDIQIATLRYSMGPESEEVIKTFDLGDLKEATYDQVLTRFDAYFKPRKNVIRLRRQFMKRVQEKGENVETYNRSLLKLAEECEFLDKSERVRDQFLVGLVSEDLVQRLEQLYLNNPLEFTLEKVVDYSKTYENNHGVAEKKSSNTKVQSPRSQSDKKTKSAAVATSKVKTPALTRTKQTTSRDQTTTKVQKQTTKVPTIEITQTNNLGNKTKVQPRLDLSQYRIPQTVIFPKKRTC